MLMPLSDIFAAVRWWAVLMLLGAVATPLCLYVLRRLPDRGYAFVKMLGVLLVTYLFWILSSSSFLANDLGAAVLSLFLVGAVSVWLMRRSDQDILAWLRQNRRQVIITELVFAAVFFFWAWVRAQNPVITGTEKPMEFAFLNAAGRSAQMPPLDPWLSGFAISYYYFGYVMTSLIARLASVAEPLAFNLGIAWLAAGAAVGAYGLVYNLVAAERSPGSRRAARFLGIVAAVAVPLAGNMQILFELLHVNGIGSAQFWAWLDVRDINGPATNTGFGPTGPRHWWWWRSSRVIHEYRLSGIPEEALEPIAEFPGFSFLLGDMHPHVLALPFAFLSLAVALAWWLKPFAATAEEVDLRDIVARSGRLIGQIGLPLYAMTVLILGGLSFLNTWDVLIHLFIVVGAFTLSRWREAGAWRGAFWGDALLLAALLAIPAALMYLPFYLGFRSQAGPPFLLPMLMRPTRLAHYLIIFGMPLTALTAFLATLAIRRRRAPWRLGVMWAVGLLLGLTVLMLLLGFIIAASPEGSARLVNQAAELGVELPASQPDSIAGRLDWAFMSIVAMAGPILVGRLASPWMILLLAVLLTVAITISASLLNRDGAHSQTEFNTGAVTPFVLLLTLTGLLLTLGPEFVYIRDNFGQRLNTVFKFYYQSWILFGASALFALDYLWRRARLATLVAGAGYAAMLAVALLFPYYGIRSRALEYGQPPTLNGITHYENTLPGELAALTWLRENVEGTPVIVEAVGGQYSPQGHGRVSATTGLPTLVGWAGHQYQWRGDTPVPAERESAVEAIYTSNDWEQTASLLDRYNVALIYVGPLERNTYGQNAAEKFEGRLEVAYANDSVIIYRWLATQG